MSHSLQHRIQGLVRQTLASYPGAWLVWCDPHGHWQPLLERAAADPSAGGFSLLTVGERTDGELGGPVARRDLQARLDAGQSLVLHVLAGPADLGWLWAQALLAERVYDRPLRDQLTEWGWRPQRLTMTDEEVAALARRGLAQDPAEWGGGGLQPDTALLLETLAGSALPTADDRLILDLTVEQAGLPAFDAAQPDRWRTGCLARLLVTQAHAAAPGVVPDNHEALIPAAQRPFALAVLDRWVDSLRLRRGLPAAVQDADRVAGLAPLLAGVGAERGPFLSYAAEAAVFATACASLAAQPDRDLLVSLAARADLFTRHSQGFWGERLPWRELERLSRAAARLLDASPGVEWATPAQAIAWYTAGGWRLDQAGEELLRSLDQPTPELLALITPLRAAYRARWERTLIQWSEVWTAAGCPVPALTTAGEWLAQRLQAARPTAILVVDALRYDLGATLAARLNEAEGAPRAAVAPARAPLPSITPLGMVLALPLREPEVQADIVDGKWQARRAGAGPNLSLAGERRAWWHSEGGAPLEAVLDLSELLSGTVPRPGVGRTRLVAYDAAIDTLGHDDELETQGSGRILDRYLAAIRRLRDHGWLRILLVTDHGYIHWSGSEERGVPPPAPGPAYLSRRAAAYPLGVALDGPSGLAPGGRWRVAVPRGAASFRAYGGLGYFHGGASLQEWIIPCVGIEWPLQARPLTVHLLPVEQVVSQRPRVALQVARPSLLIEEGLPRQVDVVIRHAQQRTILFRAEGVQVTPDQERISVSLRVEEGVTAERGTPLRIEARDRATEEILDQADSVLMIELGAW